ncbi:MAG: hypothetical protein K8T26_10460 [Lentisphaerae bacterium]|nr:hypothetical protein [Lentisphaerota bacterium]
MDPLPIYVDFDDVLCETARALTGLLEREFGRRVAFEDIHHFNLGKSFALDDAELQHLMELAHEPDFLGVLEPIPGAIDGLRRWAEAGHAVHIVTGRPASTHAICDAWLRRFEVPHARVIFVNKYGRDLLPGGSVRAISLDELAGLRFALAVEDAPKAIRFLLERTPTPVAVMDRPWNLREPFDDRRGQLHRCRDWAHILEQFPLSRPATA